MGPSEKRAARAVKLIKAGETGEDLADCFGHFDEKLVLGWLMIFYDRDPALQQAIHSPEMAGQLPKSFFRLIGKDK